VPNLANDISDAAPSALYGVAMLLFMYAMPHGVVGTLGPLLTRSMLRIQARWPALIGK
jgi:branched-chain amino acid transport system permease protein